MNRPPRAELERVLASEPFPRAGAPIIPGVVSVGAPDFGIAYSTGRPVSGLIAAALPVTLLLNLIALPLIYIIAVPGGVLAAVKRGRRLIGGWAHCSSDLWSVPVVLAAVLAMGFLASPDYFAWFPASGLH
jgi:peptide/nickel transport system permease protein